ncbi:hypothetical protein [Mesorhizobium sp. M0589]|uniref:hypothetical protein n=1 Tax=Mesorhizobium sp. M0589 TaxID=2956965 RepID=UPI003334F2AA
MERASSATSCRRALLLVGLFFIVPVVAMLLRPFVAFGRLLDQGRQQRLDEL